jgi:hypothetical protein
VFADGETQGLVERWGVEWESAPMLRTLDIEAGMF